MSQFQPRGKRFIAKLKKSLRELSKEPIKEYLSSSTKDGHNPQRDYFDTFSILMYANDYYGYDAPRFLSYFPNVEYAYNRFCSNIFRSLNEQLSILRAEFNTLKLIDLDGSLHIEFELLLEALLADIAHDISLEIDKRPLVAGDQSIEGFTFESTVNNTCTVGKEESVESRTERWRISVEKNIEGYSKYNIKAGEGYIINQFYCTTTKEILGTDIPVALAEHDDTKLLFNGLPVLRGDDDPQIRDFRNYKYIFYINNGVITKCRLYFSAQCFCDYLP